MHADEEITRVVTQVIAPLIWADRGDLFIVALGPKRVALHLGGRFSGCPGTRLVCQEVLEPLLRRVAPSAEIEITSGALVPSGARRLDPPAVAVVSE